MKTTLDPEDMSLVFKEGIESIDWDNKKHKLGVQFASFHWENKASVGPTCVAYDTICRVLKLFIMENSIDFDMKFRQGVCIAEVQTDSKTYHSGHWCSEIETLMYTAHWVLNTPEFKEKQNADTDI